MIRLLNLIKNEYQKIFSKVGTYVMLVLILLIAVGFQILLTNTSEFYYSDWNSTEDQVRSDLNWYKSVNTDGDYDTTIALYEAMLQYEIYDADYWGPTQSWQGAALSSAYYDYYDRFTASKNYYTEEEQAAAKTAYDAIISSIEKNDYKLYYQALINAEGENGYYTEKYNYMLEHDIAPDSDDWRVAVLDDLIKNRDILNHYQNLSEEDLDDTYYNAKTAYEIDNYRLENNIAYCITDNLSDEDTYSVYSFSTMYWSNVYNGSNMITLVCIMVIVIAGGIIASEFSQGTIKFLLINPVTRRKIFFSKYLTLLSLTALLSAGMFVVNLLVSLITGSEGTSAVYLTYEGGKVVSSGVLGAIIIPYLFSLLEAIIIITLAFMISSILRSSAVSIGISVGVLLIGSTVTALLAELGQDWGRYLLFANTNLFSIIHKQSLFPHHSLTFAIVNIIAYMAVFLLTAYDGFTRKEV